jgi:hypothetical protein
VISQIEELSCLFHRVNGVDAEVPEVHLLIPVFHERHFAVGEDGIIKILAT